MRLVSFERSGAGGPGLGALVGERVLDLALASAVSNPNAAQDPRLRTIESLLAEREGAISAVRSAFERATRPAAGSANAAIERAWLDLASLQLLPPIAHPPTIRDFYSFEEHVRNARAKRGLPVPAEWYEFPAFYFSNPGSLVGHRAPVRRPAWTRALDYELEIACVIGARARDVAEENWESVVAGFTILNDWSARDIQRKEMVIGLGPAKAKDFATSLGPALVTLDELMHRRDRDRFDLAMEARVNGVTLSRSNARDMHYSFGQMIARASQEVYLFPGDVIGSGTAGGGCILELGPEVHRWLEPGDEVSLEIECLGTLTNTIV